MMKLIVLVAALLLTVPVLNLKVTSKPSGEVKGILIAKGGDGSKKSNNNPATAAKVEVKETKKVEKIEVEEKKEKTEVEVETETETETKLETEVKEATVSGKNKFESKFSLSVIGGQLMVATPGGSMLIRILPDQAARIATAAGVQNEVEKIELAQGQDKQNVFRIKGKKTGKLLGIIPVSAETETEVNAESGLVQSVNQPLWLRLFSSLISPS